MLFIEANNFKRFFTIKVLITVTLVSLTSCQSEALTSLSDMEIRQLAWNSLDSEVQKSVVGSKEHIGCQDNDNSDVCTYVNNAPNDVWRQAPVTQILPKDLEVIKKRLKLKTKSNEIVVVHFRVLLYEISDMGPMKIYLDPKKQTVLAVEKPKMKNIVF